MTEAGSALVSLVAASVPSGGLVSQAGAPLRLTLVQSGQRSANKREEWELPALGSCITCSSGVAQPGSDSHVQLQLPRKGGSTGFDALYDSRYIHKIQLKDAFSDTEVISFINVDDVLDAIELVGLVDLPGRDGKSMLIIISCHASSNDKPSGSRILIYEVLVKPCTDADEYKDDSQITVNIHKPRLLRICALTDHVCVGINWINGENFGYPVRTVDDKGMLMFLRMDAGSVMLCKLKTRILDETYGPPDFIITNLHDMFDVIWYFNPSTNIKGEKITCTSITYRTVEEETPFPEGTPEAIKYANVAQDDFAPTHSTINIAGGTNDGFLYIWKFYWNVMCKAPGAISLDETNNPISPYFRMMIPLFPPFPDKSMARCLVSVSFLPIAESYIVVITTYSGLIIIWDIRHGILEGELKTYHSTNRPLTSVCWTGDLQYILIGGTSAMCVDWRSNAAVSTLPYDRWPRVKYDGIFDNVCWSVGATEKHANFCYDDGLFVHIPILALNRRDAHELGTTFLWEPAVMETSDIMIDDTTELASNHVLSRVFELSTRQFQADLASIRQSGICITRNGSKHRGGRVGRKRDSRLIRNKVFAHHFVKTHTAQFEDFTLFFVAYGGNAGVVQLLIKN